MEESVSNNDFGREDGRYDEKTGVGVGIDWGRKGGGVTRGRTYRIVNKKYQKSEDDLQFAWELVELSPELMKDEKKPPKEMEGKKRWWAEMKRQ